MQSGLWLAQTGSCFDEIFAAHVANPLTVAVGRIEHLKHRHPRFPSNPASEMLVVVLKTDPDERRRSRQAPLFITGFVSSRKTYFSVSPDRPMDMNTI
jgi:hypothetical protein